jgi:hypothetical protein
VAGTVNGRDRSDLRKKPRREFHYLAKILTGPQDPARRCTIADVSESGARLLLDSDDELPDRFFLLLSLNGGARRRCRVVWRNGASVGVEFVTAQQ